MQTSLAKKLFAAGVTASTLLMGLAPFAAQAAPHAVGTNVKSSDGTVWMIMPDGTRRAYTSAGAFLSYGFNSFATLVDANAEDLALTAGAFIPPQDGTIFCATVTKASDVSGECALITGGMKAAFTSEANFTGRGFSFGNAQYGDSSFLSKTTNIDNVTDANRPGVLVNDNGTVKLIGNAGVLGIPDLATFNSWGYSFGKVVPANAADKALPMSGVMAARQAGQLSPTAISGPTTPPPAAGSVSVSAAGTQTPASTVPQQATNVNVLKFNIYNGGSSAAAVTQVTVKRSGAGSTSDISNVYLYQGSSRLTSGRSINSSTNEAVFSGLNINVPAMSTVTLDVLVDIANTNAAGNVHQFMVSSVMLGSTAAVGTAMGNIMTIAGVDVGVITIAKTGSITNPKVGEQNVKIGSFTLAASSAEDLVIKRLSLFQGGSIASANVTNLVLKQGTNTVGTVAALDSKDKANFDVNFPLAKGETKTFDVYANIGAGARSGSSETLKIYLEEATDLFATGNTYGFGAAITRTTYDGDSCTSTSGDCSYSTIDGGTLTITFNGPAGKDIAKNGEDVEIFNFTMTAQNNLEVRQLAFTFDGGTGTANFENTSNEQLYTDVKVVDATTGAVVWGPQDFNDSSDTTETITFTEDIFLAAGTSKTYKVTLDVANDSEVASGDDIKATLDVDSLTSNDVKNVDNNTFLTASEIVPTSDLGGNTMNVAVSSLTVALSSTPTSKTFVKGSSNVESAGFSFTASTAGPVTVTGITLTGMIATSTATVLAEGRQLINGTTYLNVSDDVVSVELYDGTTKIGQTKSPAITTGLTAFTGLNWVIPAGSTKNLVVKMNISTAATSGDDIKWEIASGNITAVDADGNAVSDSTSYPVNGSTTITAGTTISVTGAGTITVASAGQSSSDSTDARIVAAGQAGTTLGKINFTASNEDLKLTKARINVLSASLTGSASIADDITSLYLYDGNTLVAGPVSLLSSGTSEGYANFTSIAPDFVVLKDQTRALTVKADLNTISSGADSGDEFAVNLSDSGFEARSAGSSGSTLITSFTGTYTGAYMVLRKSQPKVEVLDAGSALTNGTLTLFRFKVTAQNGDIALKHITFTSSTTTGVSLTSFAIKEMGGTALTVTGSVTQGTGTATWDVTFNSEESISSGNSKTYDVTATVAGADTGDSVSTSIAATDTAVVTGYLTSLAAAVTITDQDDTNNVGNDSNAGAVTANFVWSDKSAIPHNDTVGSSGAADWTNGRHVRTIPTDAEGLSL